MPMIDRWIIFITDRDELKRLETEPETLLSVEHALHEVCVALSPYISTST